MTRFFVLSLAFCAACACAAGFDPVAQLATRTGLSASELAVILKHCDENQANTNICAYYQLINADHALDIAAAQRRSACKGCAESTASAIAAWRTQRDRACAKSAASEWGDGSMRPTAQALCATAATQQKVEAIERVGSAPARPTARTSAG